MYLDYQDYLSRGGNLESSAFTQFNKKAEYILNSQSAGMTGQRILKLPEIPECIKECIFELIENMQKYNTNNIASESQSSGGVSESYSYVNKSEEELQGAYNDIIYTCLFGGGQQKLLYLGVLEDD